MKNKIGKIKNLIDQDTVEYFLNKYETLPKKDNGARINADTMVDQDFNKLFYDKLAKATGLGDKGIASYRQEELPDAKKVLGADIQKKWLPHLVEGIPFSIAEILTWEVGTAIYWPRINLHASAWFPEQTDRKALVVLTNE